MAQRKAPTQPKRLKTSEIDDRQLCGKQWCEFEVRHPARQRLAGLPQQVARRRAEQQEAPRPAVGVDLWPKRLEQTGHELHFVKHEQAVSMRREEEFGPLERGTVRLALEIEQHRRGWRAAMARASVVLPTWRGPRSTRPEPGAGRCSIADCSCRPIIIAFCTCTDEYAMTVRSRTRGQVGQDQETSVMPQPLTAPRSKLIVRSQPAAAAARSIRQSAKSALPP